MMIDPERPPKILVLGEYAAVHTRRWVRHFRNRGWTVRWLSFPPVDVAESVEVIPVQAKPRALAIPLAVSHVRRVIDAFAPGIVSALFLPDYGWLSALCGRHPLAVSAWGSDILVSPKKSWLHRRRIEYVLDRADLLFADAALLGSRMCDYGAQPDKIHIIPLGVERSWLDIGGQRVTGTSGRVRILTNRQLEPLYCVDTFIRAAARLDADASGRYDFELLGDGSLRTDLMALAGEVGMNGRIDFAGRLEFRALQQRVGSADLFVSCARSDGTSVSLLEAMAAGCVPIVTDLPVNREWITPGVNGLLFSVGDDRALAEAIREAVSHPPQWWVKVRERNRSLIMERALWRDNMASVEEIMRRIMNRGSR